jgi:hypothetical protein
VAARGSRPATASLLTGVGATATIPVAIFATRFSERYDLLHAAFTIPVAVALGIAAIALARRSSRQSSLSLEGGRRGLATAGRILGIAGLCLAASALVALCVYGLLEYVGSRD